MIRCSVAAGNDALNGGVGADTMAGGAGNDTYFVDNAADVVNETVGQGTDTVMASVNYSLTAGSEIEFLRANAGTTGLSLTGNALVNRLVGGVGNDTLNGGAGNDSLGGGAGNDVFRFMAGFGQDTITDFTAHAGAAGSKDLMDISGLGITAATFAANVHMANGGGGSTMVTFTGVHRLDPTSQRRRGKHRSDRFQARLRPDCARRLGQYPLVPMHQRVAAGPSDDRCQDTGAIIVSIQ